MRKLEFPVNKIILNNEIDNLITIKAKISPFKTQNESEDFYKKLIEEEMLLSNNYTVDNIENLLNLYIKGINLYQNTSQTNKIFLFQEKINLLLNNSKAKSLLNQEKEKSDLSFEQKSDPFLTKYKIWNNVNKNKNSNVDLIRSKTYKDNETLYRNKLKNLNIKIKQGIKEKEYQKKKIVEINKEFSQMENQLSKTSLFLEDEIKKQSNSFQEKLLKKKTIIQKERNLNKFKNFVINEENENFNESNEIINKKDFKSDKELPKINTNDIFKIDEEEELNLGNQNIKNSLKEKINKYFDEYNENLYNFYFLDKIKKISELINKNFSLDMKINEEYQNNIKNLLKMQIDGNDKILDEDIDSLREEQELEIQKNDDLYEKYIEEEISDFKIFGYSNSSPKELEILKNKIKCEIYNDIYKILDKK